MTQKNRAPATVTVDTAVTAMILWEEAIASLPNDRPPEQMHATWPTWLRGGGAAANRDECLRLAPFVDAAWEYAAERYEYDDCFDWEFVPAFVKEARDAREIECDYRSIVDRMCASDRPPGALS